MYRRRVVRNPRNRPEPAGRRTRETRTRALCVHCSPSALHRYRRGRDVSDTGGVDLEPGRHNASSPPPTTEYRVQTMQSCMFRKNARRAVAMLTVLKMIIIISNKNNTNNNIYIIMVKNSNMCANKLRSRSCATGASGTTIGKPVASPRGFPFSILAYITTYS